jgi:DNA-binding MarR family transcriptional regulator
MLRLTDDGRTLLASAVPVVDAVNKTMLTSIDDDERRQLRELLEKLLP